MQNKNVTLLIWTLSAIITYCSIEFDYHLQHSLCWLVQISVVLKGCVIRCMVNSELWSNEWHHIVLVSIGSSNGLLPNTSLFSFAEMYLRKCIPPNECHFVSAPLYDIASMCHINFPYCSRENTPLMFWTTLLSPVNGFASGQTADITEASALISVDNGHVCLEGSVNLSYCQRYCHSMKRKLDRFVHFVLIVRFIDVWEHWDWHKIADHMFIFQCVFANENNFILIRMNFVSNGPFHKKPTLVQMMAWHRTGDKSSSEQMV